ncbi:type 4a pilus biogenesis protein PilO [bacterium]|nr:type 4a pilus biogenesis protein PilO [bacterium]
MRLRLPAFKITRKFLQAVIAFFVVELLLFGFLIYRQQMIIGNLAKEVRDKNTELTKYSQIYRQIPQLEQTLNSLKSQLQTVEWNLPTPAYIPTFLAQLESFAHQCGVKITNISPQQAPPQPPSAAPRSKKEEEVGVKRGTYRETQPAQEKKPASPYETISLNLQVEGNFYAIQKFIDGFRRFPKALSLAKLDISPQLVEGKAPILRVSLFLNITVLGGGEAR